MDWLSAIRDIIGSAVPFLDSLPATRVILSFILVFFSGRQINIIERLALSFGLSIATVTLSTLALSRLTGMRIIGFNAVLAIIVITIMAIIIIAVVFY